jgi:hypothetical protein
MLLHLEQQVRVEQRVHQTFGRVSVGHTSLLSRKWEDSSMLVTPVFVLAAVLTLGAFAFWGLGK